MTLVGKTIEIVTNAITGDGEMAAHDTAVEITSQVTGALVGSLFPIPNPTLANSTKEFLKAFLTDLANVSDVLIVNFVLKKTQIINNL